MTGGQRENHQPHLQSTQKSELDTVEMDINQETIEMLNPSSTRELQASHILNSQNPSNLNI